MMPRLQGVRRCTSGAAAVEFAIVSMVLIALAIGIVDFGRTLYVQNQISALADRAVRKAMIDPNASSASLESELREEFFAGNAANLSISITTETAGGTSYRVVTVAFPMTLFVPGLSSDAISLNVTRRVPAG